MKSLFHLLRTNRGEEDRFGSVNLFTILKQSKMIHGQSQRRLEAPSPDAMDLDEEPSVPPALDLDEGEAFLPPPQPSGTLKRIKPPEIFAGSNKKARTE